MRDFTLPVLIMAFTFFICCGCNQIAGLSPESGLENNPDLVDNPQYAGKLVIMVRSVAKLLSDTAASDEAALKTVKSSAAPGTNFNLWIINTQPAQAASSANAGELPFAQNVTARIREQALGADEGWSEFATAKATGDTDTVLKFFYKRFNDLNGRDRIVCGAYRLN